MDQSTVMMRRMLRFTITIVVLCSALLLLLALSSINETRMFFHKHAASTEEARTTTTTTIRSRRLSGGGGGGHEQSSSSFIECKLSLDIVELVWDSDHGIFYLEQEQEESSVDASAESATAARSKHSAHLRRQHRQLHNVGQQSTIPEKNEASLSNQGRVVVKACWCLQAALKRHVQFCPAHFDSCQVVQQQASSAVLSSSSLNSSSTNDNDNENRPAEVVVTCHYASQAETFLSGFWLLFIFWLIILIVLLLFSDFGCSAREYACRKWHLFVWRIQSCRRCSCRNNNNNNNDTDGVAIEDALLQANLEHLLVHNEERVGILFQNAMAREHEQRRQQESANHNNNNNNHHSFLSIWRGRHTTTTTDVDVNARNDDTAPKLILKTKIFQSDKGIKDDEVANNNDLDDIRVSPSSSNITSILSQPTTSSSCFTFSSRRILGPSSPVSQSSSSSSSSTLESSAPSIITNTAGADEINNSQLQHHKQQQQTNEDEHEEDEQEVEDGSKLCCAICLVELQQGDVIGDIPCGHVFHKQCLKNWLLQKCKCPLCQRTDVATLTNTNIIATTS